MGLDSRFRAGSIALASSAAFAYLVLAGATPIGELDAIMRLINGLIAAVVLVVYLAAAPRAADRTDKLILIALLCFAVAAVLSPFPRQAADAFVSMCAYAAAFFVVRRLLRREVVRRSVLLMMSALAALTLTAVSLAQIRPVLQWTAILGWDPPPPASMPYDGLQWGNQYDPILLALILFPALLTGRPGRARLAATGVLGLVLAVVVLNAGSRNVWAAVVGAFVVTGVTMVHRRGRSVARPVVIGIASTLVFAVVAILVVEPLRERLLTPQTIGQRFAMWSAIIDAWASRPLVGYGPGSFPWVLQITDYFEANAIPPRHPDNAVFQLMAEAGVVGLVGAAIVVLALTRPVLQSGMNTAIWPLALFALAGINSNPTDFGFLVVPAIVWAALALPPGPAVAPGAAPIRRSLRAAFVAGSTVVAIAYVSMITASFAYQDARTALQRNDLQTTQARLETAAMLDPGMGMYWRQAGIATTFLARPALASTELRRAIAINPQDDLSWRALALSEASQDVDSAVGAAQEAVSVQRSDPTNLLLAAALQTMNGASLNEVEIAEILLAWPTLTAAPGWSGLLPDGLTPAGAVTVALDRWSVGGAAAVPPGSQPLMLVMLGHRTELVEETATLAEMDPLLIPTVRSLTACDPRASAMLSLTPASVRGDASFWALAVRAGGVAALDQAAAVRVLDLLSGRVPIPQAGQTLLNPLRENNYAGYSTDAWGYRRPAMQWPEPSILLPSPAAGEANLLYEWSLHACGGQLD